MANNILNTPYQKYHSRSYAAIDPTQPSLSNKSKSAAVTGAGSKIGASIAISLAKSAASYIALIGRQENALQETKLAIETVSTDTKVFLYAVDITDLPAIEVALEAFAQECAAGKIDILIANAGSLGPLTSIRDADPAVWWSACEINIKGNFNLVHSFLPRANSNAAVIYISSAAVHGPYIPNESSYCASKIGATKLFEYVHHEHPDMFVLSVQPGLVAETGMSAGFEYIANGLQMDMASLPWDDAALPGDFVVWAVSPEARFLNGRFVWANWDVDELKTDKEAILANPRRFTLDLRS